eukprot:PhF_6_TR5595/c1_g1_i2/m.8040
MERKRNIHKHTYTTHTHTHTHTTMSKPAGSDDACPCRPKKIIDSEKKLAAQACEVGKTKLCAALSENVAISRHHIHDISKQMMYLREQMKMEAGMLKRDGCHMHLQIPNKYA